MNRALVLAPLLLGMLAAPLQADDPRIVERLYDPTRVVRIEGRTNVQAAIAFGDDETIENVAIGNSNTWQVTPNKRANILFVKPLNATASTNMTVVTDRHTYLFDLVASPRARPLYVLRFTYPELPEEEAAMEELVEAAPPPEIASEMELAAASDPYAVVDPAQINFEWARKGAKKLMPARIFDDGNATFLTWAAGTPLPAILVKDAEGTEGPVNFTTRGETIVVDGVPREIVLRSGEDSAVLTNKGPVRPQPELARTDLPAEAEKQ